MKREISPGTSYPLGATPLSGGVNFSVYSRTAQRVSLLLFRHRTDAEPSRRIMLDPVKNRTYHYWHVFVPDVTAGQIYGYQIGGDEPPGSGNRFDEDKVLLDPYGKAVVIPDHYAPESATFPGSNCATAMKSAVVDIDAYDWENDQPLRLPSSRTVVYEMHVRGFTRHPQSGVAESKRGTYAGLIEKIPYLQKLGITAVELLPVFAFDPLAVPKGLVNYWGYQPVSFFAPHPAFSSKADPGGTVNEFRDMVKALHRAGIEVILDVVFNHTAEGGKEGPTLCFRGIDNPTYYILERDGAGYADYSGCGNTFNANHPVVRRLIVDSLRHWVKEMHVDGFRFDLASILARGQVGEVLPNPPVLWDIESDPLLAGTKLIAEAWDAAGLYQVGSFVGDSWKEWNGRFRDDVRDFFRSADGSVGRFADRLLGSHSIYGHENREPEQSVNFVACHDGFSLNDIVSYNTKHNEANRENNRDGGDDNRSWNCGVEGPSTDPAIEALRDRQVKNMLCATVLSLGVPMILMGDEVRRTQNGNNNAYCHDDESNWFDWSLTQKHAGVMRFVQLLLARRAQRDVFHEEQRISLSSMLARARKSWHGVRLDHPDWREHSHSLALSLELPGEGIRVHMMFNAYWEALEFELPPLKNSVWRLWIDTGQLSPMDISPWAEAPVYNGSHYRTDSRSVVVLYATVD